MQNPTKRPNVLAGHVRAAVRKRLAQLPKQCEPCGAELVDGACHSAIRNRHASGSDIVTPRERIALVAALTELHKLAECWIDRDGGDRRTHCTYALNERTCTDRIAEAADDRL